MGKVTTGAYQATGSKMEGRVQQANFSRPAKVGVVKATEQLPPSSSPKPFVRKSLPGMRAPTAGGIARPMPASIQAGSHQVMPHIRNSGE